MHLYLWAFSNCVFLLCLPFLVTPYIVVGIQPLFQRGPFVVYLILYANLSYANNNKTIKPFHQVKVLA